MIRQNGEGVKGFWTGGRRGTVRKSRNPRPAAGAGRERGRRATVKQRINKHIRSDEGQQAPEGDAEQGENRGEYSR